MEYPRVTDPADPRRCKATTATGQCLNVAYEGCTYCWAHGAAVQAHQNERRGIYEIKRAQVRAELQRQASHPQIMRLEEEIGLMRMLIQENLNASGDNILQRGTVLRELVLSVEKLVSSYERLMVRSGQMIDKSAMNRFAMQIATAAASHIPNPTDVAKFMADVIKIVETIDAPEE